MSGPSPRASRCDKIWVEKLMQGRAMDAVVAFLQELKQDGRWRGHFLGLLNILIGRRLEGHEGRLVSAGLSWRTTAELLKKVRWDKTAVLELKIDPQALPPRDRGRYWYMAIATAGVDSPAAVLAANALSNTLAALGYRLG
jgi:hypothetical protein